MDNGLKQKPAVREFRAKLGAYLNANEPAVVERHGRTHALVVPIPRHWRYDQKTRAAALSETKRRVKSALELAFGTDGAS